jgi:hypothetical protein
MYPEVQASNNFLLTLIFHPEDGGSAFFRGVGELQPDRTTSPVTLHTHCRDILMPYECNAVPRSPEFQVGRKIVKTQSQLLAGRMRRLDGKWVGLMQADFPVLLRKNYGKQLLALSCMAVCVPTCNYFAPIG